MRTGLRPLPPPSPHPSSAGGAEGQRTQGMFRTRWPLGSAPTTLFPIPSSPRLSQPVPGRAKGIPPPLPSTHGCGYSPCGGKQDPIRCPPSLFPLNGAERVPPQACLVLLQAGRCMGHPAASPGARGPQRGSRSSAPRRPPASPASRPAAASLPACLPAAPCQPGRPRGLAGKQHAGICSPHKGSLP